MDIIDVVQKQLGSVFCCDKQQLEKIGALHDEAMECAKTALSGFNNKYLTAQLNPFNSVIYCNYLYWLSRKLYLNKENDLADRVYYLNKMLNSVDLFYAIELPRVWSCEHPLGSIMGRAKYSDGFFFYQGCTVGGNRNKGVLEYPTIGENVIMYSDSKIIGSSRIGNNVLISANAYIKNETIPDNSIVFGQSPNLIIKSRKDV